MIRTIFFKKKFKSEMYSTIFQITLGILITLISAMAIFQFAHNFNLFLNEYKNYIELKMFSSSLIILISIFCLYYIFLIRPRRNGLTISNSEKSMEDELYELAGLFLKGFLEGYTKVKK